MSGWTLELVRDINELIEKAAEEARDAMRTGYSLDLVRLIFKHPYAKIQHLVDAGLGNRKTASRYLSDLERIGILSVREEHRDKYFVNEGLLRLLTRA